MFSFQKFVPPYSHATPMLHNLHHFPPFKHKTMNIILIPKLLHRINKLITTSKLLLVNLSMNDKTTKQQTIFSAMMGMMLSKP
jgi:hypothetical protein